MSAENYVEIVCPGCECAFAVHLSDLPKLESAICYSCRTDREFDEANRNAPEWFR